MLDGIWVFGYGSLMWDPGFPHVEAQPALLRGWHRAFCVHSIRYRGTPERPGVVLGLDRGGSCRGRAFRVAAGDAEAALAYLDEREMLYRTYRRRSVPVALPERRVTAYTYVADRHHPRYCGVLSQEGLVELVLDGRGIKGSCLDYVIATVDHLDRMGIADGPIHRLLDTVRARLREPVPAASGE